MPSGSIDPNDIDNPATAEKLYTVAKIVEGWAKGTKFKITGMAHDGVEFDGLHLRSMGALKKTLEKNYLAQLAIQHGLTLQEVIEAADLTLNQLSEALHTKAPKGKKTFVVDSFQKEAIDTGVVEVGPTRYTLSSK
jgi:lambda repressor-like predicted transcriptional regulator